MNKADQRDFDSHYEYWDKIKEPTGGEMSREYETFIVCPYCAYQHQDMCDYPFVKWNDGEEKGIDCDECGKNFDVIINVSYSFSSYTKEEADSK